MQPFTNPEPLRKAIHEQRPLAFVGAGLSVRAGYPTWASLLERLVGKLNRPELQRSAIRDDVPWQAEEIRAAFQDDERPGLCFMR